MSLTITRAGIYDSIRDGGRMGYRYLGINCGGAMDGHSMALANALAGNPETMAVLEMHFPAAEMTCDADTLLVICGGDFSATINNIPFGSGQPAWITKGSVLRFSKWISGARLYLAVSGGFLLPGWLGSDSTDLQAGKGGWKGRCLKRGDQLPFAGSNIPAPRVDPGNYQLPWFAAPPAYAPLLKILPGRQWHLLSEAAKAIFQQEKYTVTGKANRMGIFLQGNPMFLENAGSMLSVPVGFGTVQLLPGGQLVILGADHQATGGYPVIAHVISAHLGALAQLNPGDKVRFEWTTGEEAIQILAKQQMDLLQLKNAATLKLDQWLQKPT